MRLPRDPVIHSTQAEYFLASHARWAVWAKQMRLQGNLRSARFYAALARQSLADWQESSARAARVK
jgi:hypothetical protein